jgi:short-subunit dehydrogenase
LKILLKNEGELLKKKTVLITGASRGLGKELAQVFADKDYNLILHSKKTKFDEVKKSFGWSLIKREAPVNCETIIGDITDTSVVYKLMYAAENAGGVDVIINNAGIHKCGEFEKVEPLYYKQTVAVNLVAPMMVTKYLWESVKKKQGLILFINSIGGKVGAKDEFLYCASKHGLKGFADSIQFDATKAGINVVSAYLGAMKTDMSKHRKDFDKLMDPKDAARFIYDVCKDYKSMRVTEIDVCRRVYGD